MSAKYLNAPARFSDFVTFPKAAITQFLSAPKRNGRYTVRKSGRSGNDANLYRNPAATAGWTQGLSGQQNQYGKSAAATPNSIVI